MFSINLRFEPFHSIVPRNISSQHEEVHDYLVNQTSIAMSSIFECNFLEVPFNTISRFPQADKMLKCKFSIFEF